MPADVLTSPSPPAVVEPAALPSAVAPPPVAPPQPSDGTLVGDFDRVLRGVREEQAPERSKVEAEYEKAAKKDEDFRATTLRPAGDAVRAAASVPAPPIPKAIPQPPVPDQKPRPFLSAEGKEALPAIVSALGLLATTIMGARNAPQAGLSALTGAMNGWAEGDHIRADRQWREYLGYVDKVKKENDEAWKTWEAMMAGSHMNLTRAQANFAVAMAEKDMPQYGIAAAERGMAYAEKDIATTKGIIDMALRHSETVSRDRATDLYRERSLNLKEREFQHKLQEGGAVDLSPDTLAGISKSIQKGVPMSNFSFGFGKKAAEARIKILNSLFADPGTTPEGLAQAQQMYKAIQGGLNKNLVMQTQIGSFINTTRSVMARAKKASETSAIDGTPILSKWIQAGRIQVDGNPEVTNFDILNGTVAMEWARAINSATGGGVSTVEARQYALSKLSTAYTPKQYAGAIDTLDKELSDRVEGFVQETKTLQDGLAKIGPKSGGGDSGKIKVIAPNGQPGMVPAGTDLSKYPGWKRAD